jgi:hypothetical protein
MPPFPVKMNQTQEFESAGSEVEFKFDKIMGKKVIDGKFTHPLAVVISSTFTVVQAANSPAIKGYDLAALFNVTLQRDAGQSDTIMLPDIPGDLIQYVSILRSGGGIVAFELPADIDASVPGDEQTRTVKLHIFFDRPHQQEHFRHDNVSWLGAFENGLLKVRVGNIASVYAENKFSIKSAATRTVSAELQCITKDAPQIGQDLRWQIIQSRTSENGNVAALGFPKGVYELMLWAPRKFGNSGSENEAKLTKFSGATGGESILLPDHWTGEDYNDAYARAGAWLARLDTSSPVGLRKGVVIKAIPPFAPRFQEQFVASNPFDVNIEVDGTITNNHRILIIRLALPSAVEDARNAGRACIEGGFSAHIVAGCGPTTRERGLMLARVLKQGLSDDPKLHVPPPPPGCKPVCKC